MSFKPNSDFILVRKCINDHLRDEDGEVLLYFDDFTYDTTNWVEIVGIGPKCKTLRTEHIGGFVQSPDWHNDLHPVHKTKDESLWVIRESLILEYGVFASESSID